MSDEKYKGYCVKCKEKRDFTGAVTRAKNGRPMAQGDCPVCTTKVTTFLKLPAA